MKKKTQENMTTRKTRDESDYKKIRALCEAQGHRLDMTQSELKNVNHIRFYCRCGNSEPAITSLRRIKVGGGCSKCRLTRAIATKQTAKELVDTQSEDVAVVRGNVLAQRKKDAATIARHASATIASSVITALRNGNLQCIQLAELVIVAAAKVDGWVYVGHTDRSYFVNNDGRFASASLSEPTMVSQRELRDEYPQIKLGGKMVYIHREFALNFCVADTSCTDTITTDWFEEYDFASFCERWIQSARERKISETYIQALQSTFTQFGNVKTIRVPTVKLHADHTVPDSRELYTAIRLVSIPKHVRDTIARGERTDAVAVMLLDTATMLPVQLDVRGKKQHWCQSANELGEAICKAFPRDDHPKCPANVVYTSLTKAKKEFEITMKLPTVFTSDMLAQWRSPKLVTVTGCDTHIVTTTSMYWTYLEHHPELQTTLGMTTPLTYSSGLAKQFGRRFDMTPELQQRLYIYPFPLKADFNDVQIGVLADHAGQLNSSTIFTPVSVRGDLLQELRPQADNKGGYMYVQIAANGKKASFYLHHLLGFMFPRTEDVIRFRVENVINLKTFVVNHYNGDTSDWHPSNLNWLTRRENATYTSVARDIETLRLAREQWVATQVHDYSTVTVVLRH